ncbi:MAG TPA: hypothetical protein VGQ95_01190 [Chthoniobacterales bacterium]|nr:hypothetical protein [Chthoniobacterales bacterium]
MKHPTVYSLSIIAAILTVWINPAAARPIGFSELSLLVRMHEPEASIKNEVAERKLLHGLTQPQEGILKSQGASDSLIKSLRDSNLVASKDEVAAAESAAREASAPSAETRSVNHQRHVEIFDVAFGHPINLSRWGGLDYEIAFYSYRFAGEDHIQPALIDQVGTRTVIYKSIPLESENEVFTEDWYPTNGVRNWRYTPYNGSGGTLYNGRGDFRDTRSINFSDSVAVSSYSVSRPIAIDWRNPQFIDGQPYTFYPVYVGPGVSLYFINASSDSARVAVVPNDTHVALISGNIH